MTTFNHKWQGLSSRQRVVLALFLLGIIGLPLRLVASNEKIDGKAGGKEAPIVSVGVATAEKMDMPVVLNALGTVTPMASVAVKTQVGGELMRIAFDEGQKVQKGTFLAQIDPRPYHLALAQAEGQLAKDQAVLRDAQLNLARYQKLFAQDSISRQQLDTQAALVAQYMGVVRTDLAQIGTARLNLSYCRITSPVAGRIGLRQVDVGNQIKANSDTPMVTITQVQPITVLFSVPETNLPAIRKQLNDGSPLEATAFDRNQASVLAKGVVAAMDSQIDTSTGTIKIRAQFDNEDEALYPNQFVNIRLVVDVLRDATVIPSAAIQRGSVGTYVYLVNPSESTVSVRSVKLGAADADRVQVVEGVSSGDQIVIDGADRLREGAKISIPPRDEAAKAPFSQTQP